MISEKDLQEAIAECQGIRNPNSSTCVKLAAYYIIKEHLYGKNTITEPGYSYAAPPVNTISHEYNYNSDTEFAKAIKGRPVEEILPVIDELMSTLNVINPRLYEGVMTKILM